MHDNTKSSILICESAGLVYKTAHAEIVIGRPPADVWAALLWSNVKAVIAWNPTVTELSHVSGGRDQEGEVTKAVKQGTRTFFMRTIRLVPLVQRVLHLYGEGYENGGNFVDHSLYPCDGGTKFVYRNYAWQSLSAEELAKVRANRESATADLDSYFANALELLKSEVERTRG